MTRSPQILLTLVVLTGCNQILDNQDAELAAAVDGGGATGGVGGGDSLPGGAGGLGWGSSPAVGGGGGAGAAGGAGGLIGVGGCDTMGGCDLDCDGALAEGPCGGDDCSDAESSVYPGQDGWFTAPRADGSFDYDCNGAEEMEHTTSKCSGTVCTAAQDVFLAIDTTDVACGVTGTFGNCSTLCAPSSTEQLTQRCR